MKEKKNLFQKNKPLLLVIASVFLMVAIVGITYAFFNYTRTGSANTVRVGRISFNSSQTNMSLTNVFPISSSDVGTDTDNVITATVTVDGDTNYSGGIEYLVTTVDVNNTVGNKTVPISLVVTASNGLGTSDNSYYTNRNSTNSSIYKIEAGETINEGGYIIVGYIAPDNNQTGVNGTITIKAYIDMNKVAISDTYDGTASDNMGTTSDWVNGRMVFTTTEWNSFTSNPLSFKIKVEANEDIWVKPLATMSLSPASGSVNTLSSTTSTISTNGDGTKSCQSSDTNIATCSISGSTLTINGVSAGRATITVNQAEGTNYGPTSATYSAQVVWVQQTAVMSLSPASGTVYTEGSKTSTISTTGDGTLSCTSSNTSIATCSVSGSTLTINGVDEGSATITVNQAAGANYGTASATYAATVVEAPPYPIIESCLGCKFAYLTGKYTVAITEASQEEYENGEVYLASLETFEDNGETLVDDYTTLNKDHFLGFKFDGYGNVTNAYACGIKGENPNNGTAFCIEGAFDDNIGGDSTTRANVYSANTTLLSSLYGAACNNWDNYYCEGSVNADVFIDGSVQTFNNSYTDYCHVYSYKGDVTCEEW